MVKKILKKMILILLIIILCFIFIKGFIYIKDKNNIKNIKEFKNEEIINVIVSINPSIVFKIKNDTVIDSMCLNEDCNSLLKKMNYTYDNNINNHKLDKVIDEFYNGAKTNGYDVSNGIDVYSASSKVEKLVQDIEEVKYEKITIKEEQKIINNVDSDFIKNEITKEEYNNELLSKLKKDSDYNKTFTCKIENEEVKCYMTEYMLPILENFGDESYVVDIAKLFDSAMSFRNLLEKFDIEYNLDGMIINSITLSSMKSYNYTDKYERCTKNKYDSNGTAIGCEKLTVVYNALELDEDKYLSFSKVNLLDKTFDEKDIIIVISEE